MFGIRTHIVALAARALFPLCLLGLSSCDLKFAEQELRLRHNCSADTLEMLIVYHGISAPSDGEAAVGKGVGHVKRLMGGEREFMLADWPLYFEIDKWAERAREHLEGEETQPYDRGQSERYLQIAARISLVSHSLFLDEAGRLSGYQLFHIRQFSETVTLLNQMVSAAVLDDVASGGLAADDDFDERTAQLVAARAESGKPWFMVDGDGITVDLPFSRELTRKWRETLFHEIVQSDGDNAFADMAAVLAGSITSLVFEEDRMLGSISPDSPGRYDWMIRSPLDDHSGLLLKALRDDDVLVREDLNIDQVRALLK